MDYLSVGSRSGINQKTFNQSFSWMSEFDPELLKKQAEAASIPRFSRLVDKD